MPVGVKNLDGQNGYYLVFIDTGYGLVSAWLPDEYAIGLTENWNFIVGGGAPSIINLGVPLFNQGARPTNQYLTAQIWSGSSPLRFSLPLRFVARRDAVTEVIEPIKTLMKAALPLANGGAGLLIPPGPSITGKVVSAVGTLGGLISAEGSDAYAVSLFVGSYLHITSLFIENIDVSFTGKLDPNGNPMEGKAVVRLSTLYAPVAQDIDQFFGASGATGGGAFPVVARPAPALNP